MDNMHRRLIRKEEYDRLKGMTETMQRDIFIRDQEDCEEVVPEEWEKRPRIEKAKESFARIFSQVL